MSENKINADMKMLYETITMLGKHRHEIEIRNRKKLAEVEDLESAIRALILVYGTWHYYQVEDSLHD